MKRTIMYFSIGAALLAGSLLSQSALAVDLPTSSSQFAKKFSGNGKVDQVNFKNESIVVDDRQYKLYTYMRVYKPDGSTGTSDLLKKGIHIYFNTAEDKVGGYRVINEIWISRGE